MQPAAALVHSSPDTAAVFSAGTVAAIACFANDIRDAHPTDPAWWDICDVPRLIGINLPTTHAR